ncbi:DNA glycosylase [Amylostereum chailletii]|nr:DNA glycosylase [Amylostereum chailletii]
MAKRKLSSRDDDEYGGASTSELEDLYDSAASKRKRGLKPTRRAPKKPKSSDPACQDDTPEDSYPLIPHPASRHLIQNSAPIQDALLSWFVTVHDVRGMPWRKRFDASLTTEQRAQRAYEVWVSEIMLQQTQVATVIAYYNKWMESFPTINDLAASDIDTVNALWKGLGYYSRAARILAGAKKVMDELDGRLPDNAKDMQSVMPGIGRYTAGAICSIAYNEQAPVLDGNVTRLLSRVLALHAPPKAKTTQDILWAGAEAMVKDCSRAGDLNQALIELGSTVCKPRDPTCGSCPLKSWCKAHQVAEGDSVSLIDAPVADIEEICASCEPIPQSENAVSPPVTSYPMKVERKKQREELDIVNVIEWHGNDKRWFLLVRRPEEGLLAGLHEFPTLPDVPDTIVTSDIKRVPYTLLSKLLKHPPHDDVTDDSATTGSNVKITKIQRSGDVLHIFSHIRKTYRVQWVVLEGGEAPPDLIPNSFLPSTPKASLKSKKATGNGKGRKASAIKVDGSTKTSTVTSKWVQLDDVEHANVGTGVMKIWKLVRSLWENT